MNFNPTRLSQDFSCAPQIAPDDMTDIAAQGYKTILNFRPDGEGGAEQPTSAQLQAAAEQHGLHYYHFPIVAGTSGAEHAADVIQVYAAAPKPVLGFCRTGARATKQFQVATAAGTSPAPAASPQPAQAAVLFRQLFDPESSTYTYFLADAESREAVFIDPVTTHLEEYLQLQQAGGYQLKYSLETHAHADHITGSGLLRQRTGAKTGVNEHCGAKNADLQLTHGETLAFGKQVIHIIGTPGHTPGSTSFLVGDRLFTGDSLFINGCGRTDFQGGDAGTQYDSIVGRLFTLPDETLVYPGHDYNGRRVSNIGQERSINPRLAGKSRDEFIQIMNNLNLPKPKLIDIAVPANRRCGFPEEEQAQG